ncbi:MAG: hypothetical protein V3U49_01295 [Nitrososphaerales archaeon]
MRYRFLDPSGIVNGVIGGLIVAGLLKAGNRLRRTRNPELVTTLEPISVFGEWVISGGMTYRVGFENGQFAVQVSRNTGPPIGSGPDPRVSIPLFTTGTFVDSVPEMSDADT